MPKHLSQRSVVISHDRAFQQGVKFVLSEPEAPLCGLVQAIWSVSVLQSEPLVKPLYADAGSGIIFNLFGEVTLGNKTLPNGIIMLPVKRKAENIVLRSGAQLAGIRFHPAIGYGVLGQHYDKPSLLAPEDEQLYKLQQIYAELRLEKDYMLRLETLGLWAANNLDFTNVIPNSMEKALKFVEQAETLEKLGESTHMSQRQIERYFRSWLGMTPKHYQRILRIKKAICFLRSHKNVKLVDVAHQFGFSDQAHMTREFRAIARITPGQV